MILNRIRIANLRNHGHTEIDCPDGTLLLVGENGAGKTSVLEAVSLLCTSRSFVTHLDRSLLRRDAARFEVEGSFTSSSASTRSVHVRYDADPGRKLLEMDNAPLAAASDLIGVFPLVALSPQHRPITAGGPGERRSFIDFVISQLHHRYLLDLIAYRRILRQRNALLADHDQRPADVRATLEAWDASLAESAVRILRHRQRFVEEFVPYLQTSMEGMIGSREEVSLRYVPTVEIDVTAEDATDAYRAVLARRFDNDLRRGNTTVGPHRDELDILLNDLDVRAHASQGQHKTVLISLKLAEYRFLDAQLDETPILLLDDVFSELDDERLANVLRLVDDLGQTFITTANQSTLRAFPQHADRNLTIRVDAGAVYSMAEVA